MIKNNLQRAIILLAVSLLMIGQVHTVYAADVKDSAPERYVVKKGDTLWDISGFYLEEPWRWPELWVKNTQIENPHLIYPGDVLILSFVDGKPVLSKEREKQRFVLTPTEKRKDKHDAIDFLPWALLEPYVDQSWIVNSEEFEGLPKVLGNGEGTVTFANNDLLLTNGLERSEDQFYVARNRGSIIDMQGNELGIQLNHVADAKVLVDDLESETLVRIENNKQEVVRGDLLWKTAPFNKEDLQLKAAENVTGFVLRGFQDHSMFGKFDVVIVDIGRDKITPGSVLGIYSQGPDILDKKDPKYLNESNTTINSIGKGNIIYQPAIKLGEVVVFSVFEKVSFGIITRSKKPVRRGFIVGAP